MASILNQAIRLGARKYINPRCILSNTNNLINHPKIVHNYSSEAPKKHENSSDNNTNNNNPISHVPNDRKRRLPTLMEFPEIIWPSLFKSIKNWIMINFVIRPYFDREFELPDFVKGTEQALQVVSNALSDGDFNGLEDIVSPCAITELKTALSQMSLSQRSELKVSKEDIYFAFPYQVGVMFDESNEKIQKRWVEITMIFHVFRGLKDIQEKNAGSSLKITASSEYMESVSICNYRFIKEFTQGVESSWVVNVVNHFKPADYMRK